MCLPRLFNAPLAPQTTLGSCLRAVTTVAAATLGLLGGLSLLGCSPGGGCTPGAEGCQCATGPLVVACTEGFTCNEQSICVADPSGGMPLVPGMPVTGNPPAGPQGPSIPTDVNPVPTDGSGPTPTGGVGPTPANGGMPSTPGPTGGSPPTGTGGMPPSAGGNPITSGGNAQTGGSTPVPMGGGGPIAEPEPVGTTVENPCDGMGTDDCDPGCSAAENAGSAFMLCDASAAKTYEQAAMHCESHGMRLARLDSLEEYQWLGSLVFPAEHPNWVAGDLGTRVWIGLTNQGDNTFAWEDGSPLEFVAWGPGEPSYMYEGAAENCIHYWNNPPDLVDILNDTDCNDVLPYACRAY